MNTTGLYPPTWTCEPVYDSDIPFGFRPYQDTLKDELLYYDIRARVNVANERLYIVGRLSPDVDVERSLPYLLRSMAQQLEKTVGQYVLYGTKP